VSFFACHRKQYNITVSAYWRTEEKELGEIRPSSTLRFTVKDEAAIKFIATYENGRELTST